MRYLITFACYGAHLHGDEPGIVDRDHSYPGSPFAEPNPNRLALKRKQMDQAAYYLHPAQRAEVLGSLREVCTHCKWQLWAAHVRTNHVHAVVEADIPPERIMNTFKSYASRALNQLETENKNRKRWARHGSTRWLPTDHDVQEAIRYVVQKQGKPMALYQANLL